MYIRSDSNLKWLLLRLQEDATSADAVRAISETLEHRGQRSPYRGGRRLVELLEHAQADGERQADQDTAEGLADAIGYALGTVLGEDLEAKYDLYDGSGQDPLRMAQRALSGTWSLLVQELDSYLAERPAASIADVREHFESLEVRLSGSSRLAEPATTAPSGFGPTSPHG